MLKTQAHHELKIVMQNVIQSSAYACELALMDEPDDSPCCCSCLSERTPNDFILFVFIPSERTKFFFLVEAKERWYQTHFLRTRSRLIERRRDADNVDLIVGIGCR